MELTIAPKAETEYRMEDASMNIRFSYLTPQRGARMTSSEPVAMASPRGARMTSSEPVAMVSSRGAGMTSSEPVHLASPRGARMTSFGTRGYGFPTRRAHDIIGTCGYGLPTSYPAPSPVIPAKAGIWRDGGRAYSLAWIANESNGTRAGRNLTRFPPARE